MNQGFLIILFDGICNLCNGSVNFIIDRDPDKKFRFAALQSEGGVALLKKYNLSSSYTDSIVLIRKNKIFTKSRAVLEIARELKGWWGFFYIFRILPPILLDLFYDMVARSRYRIFGKRETCRIPEPELLDRFL